MRVRFRLQNPGDKAYKLADGGGLYLMVNTNGSKYWRMKYRFAGKEKKLSFGTYPDISFAEARTKRDEARKVLANDKDPGEEIAWIIHRWKGSFAALKVNGPDCRAKKICA